MEGKDMSDNRGETAFKQHMDKMVLINCKADFDNVHEQEVEVEVEGGY